MDALAPRFSARLVSPSDPAPVDEQVGHLLRCAQKRSAAVLADSLAEIDLTPAQFFALARLDELGRTSQNHLGRLTAMDPATIQGVIQRLAARGLVERGVDANDRRRTLLALTPEGHQMAQELRQLSAGVDDKVLSPLNTGEREAFLRLLKRLT